MKKKYYQLRLNADLYNTPCSIYLEIGDTYEVRSEAEAEALKLNTAIAEELGDQDEDVEYDGFSMNEQPRWGVSEIEIK